jgi:aspartate-semialdehyde dehydrogenase
LAVLGVETPSGADVRRVLEDREVPGERVDLYGATASEAVLSEYRGEARLIQPADGDALATHGLVFVCSPEALPRGDVARTAGERLVIDLTGSENVEVAHSRLRPVSVGSTAAWRVPHAIALFLLDVLEPIVAAGEVEHVTATVLRPASDLGEAGVEELRRQVSGLMNFGELPTEVFGRRLAFTCLPQSGDDERAPDVERRIERDVRALLSERLKRFSVRLVWIPAFFGHTASLHLRMTEPDVVDGVIRRLESASGIERRVSAGSCRFEDGSADPRILVGGPDLDGEDGFWVWAVAEDVGAAAAREAVRLAESAGLL